MKSTMTKEQLASLDIKTCTEKELIEAYKLDYEPCEDLGPGATYEERIAARMIARKRWDARDELIRRAYVKNGLPEGGYNLLAKTIRRKDGEYVRRADGSLAKLNHYGGQGSHHFWVDYFGDGSEGYDAMTGGVKKHVLELIAAIQTFEGAR